MKTAQLAGLGALLLCAAHAQSPVVHWSFDSTSSDYVVENMMGPKFDLIATHKKEALKLVDGIKGKALNFADSGSVVVISDSRNSLNFPQCTMEALVYYSPGSRNQSLIENATYNPGVAKGFSFIILANGTVSLNTGSQPNGGASWNTTTTQQQLVEGRAYHLAAVIDQNGSNKVYIDGEVAAVKSSTPFLPNSGTGLFGVSYGDSKYSGWAKSVLDEVKIYDYALGDADIQSNYQEYQSALDSLNAL